jgi:hypothetical protein
LRLSVDAARADAASRSKGGGSGGWINVTAGAAVGWDGGGLRLESGATTRGAVSDHTEAVRESLWPDLFLAAVKGHAPRSSHLMKASEILVHVV